MTSVTVQENAVMAMVVVEGIEVGGEDEKEEKHRSASCPCCKMKCPRYIRPLSISSAEAVLVANGTLCTSHNLDNASISAR